MRIFYYKQTQLLEQGYSPLGLEQSCTPLRNFSLEQDLGLERSCTPLLNVSEQSATLLQRKAGLHLGLEQSYATGVGAELYSAS